MSLLDLKGANLLHYQIPQQESDINYLIIAWAKKQLTI